MSQVNKVRLFSYIFKVKGKKRWSIYDLLRKKLFLIDPGQGDTKTLKKALIENDLVYKTRGEPVAKLVYDLTKYMDYVTLRNLYIRITSKCDYNCSNCGDYCQCYSNQHKTCMDKKTLNRIINQVKKISIERVVVTGGNPFIEMDVLKKIKTEIIANEYIILFRKPNSSIIRVDDCKKMGYNVISNPLYKTPISENRMIINPFAFYYTQKYNMCLGNSISIDTDGDIRPCLWFNKSIGNINTINLKLLIQKGSFDLYWKNKKDRIKVCSDCEYRYACRDCLAHNFNNGEDILTRSKECNFDPYQGSWMGNKESVS